MTIANLGIAVQSQSAAQGAVDLNKLEAAAKGAEAATDRLAAGSRSASAAVGQMNQAMTAEVGAKERATLATKMHAAALHAEASAARMASFQRRNLMFQLNDVGVSLASGMNPLMVLVQQGSQIATIYEGGVVPALKETGNMAALAASRFAPLIALAALFGVSVAAMRQEINQAGHDAVSFGDVALAAFQVPANAIYEVLQPAITSVSGWWSDELDIFADQTKMIVNFLTQNFLAGFETIKAGVMTMPDAFIVAGEQAANGFISGVEWMVQKALEGVNSITTGLQGLVDSVGGDFLREQLGLDISIPALVDPGAFKLGRANIGGTAAQGRIDAAGSALSARTAGIYRTDYAGEWFGAIIDQSAANAANRLAGEVEGLGGAAKAANDNAKSLGVTLTDAARAAHQEWEFYRGTFTGFFSDLRQGLQDGQGFWQSFGNAASKALDSIADRMLSMATNGLFDMLLGGMFGGVGNSLGAGWGVAGGFTGFKGIFGIPGMAEGGTVGRAGLSWVGERGPELLRLPQGAQVIPNGPAMAMAANQDGAGIVINNVINVPAGTSPETAPAIAREVTKELRRQLPDAIDQYNRNPLRRAG